METQPTAVGGASVRKHLSWIVFVCVNILLWVFFGYYIIVNTVLKDQALVRALTIRIGDSNVTYVAGATDSTPDITLAIELNGVLKQVSAKSINFTIDSSPVYQYGKGSDIFAVWLAALNNIQNPIVVNPEVEFDTQELLKQFNIDLASQPQFAVRWHKELLVGCESLQYAWSVDTSKLTKAIAERLGNAKISLDLDQFVTAERPALQFELCSRYTNEIEDKLAEVNNAVGGVVLKKNLLALDNQGSWKLADEEIVVANLNEISANTQMPAVLGEYQENNGEIWLLEPYQAGQRVNTQQSLASLKRWLDGEEADFIAYFDRLLPDELNSGKRVLDFTNVVAAGKTRVDIVRNGYLNPYLKYAQYGVEAMQDVIIQPGQEFSYIDTIKPQPRGRMANGLPIGGGICNATTTMYRAALEAGFPITERSPHGFYVASYEWGYPLNVVDAAYYTNPRVDLKFVNDYDYPVLLQTEIRRDEADGWQYHTIHVRTSSKVPKRKVEFVDWQKYSVYSAKRYTGEFTRIVSAEDSGIIRQDKFISRYYR